MKYKEFRLSELDLVTKKQPLDSWAVAHLFYGVPRWAKYAWQDIKNGGIIFANKLSIK